MRANSSDRRIRFCSVDPGEFLLDLGAEGLDADFMNEEFDPRLAFVVAPPFEIVDAQRGFEIAEQIFARQEIAQDRAFHRRAAEARRRRECW